MEVGMKWQLIILAVMAFCACDTSPPASQALVVSPAAAKSTPTQTAVSRDSGQIRFVAFGDQGTGSPMQHKVAAAVGRVCERLGGCDFGLLLGDNFYGSGVASIDDPQWVTAFEEPYGALGFPFYAVLGNHDLGGDGLGLDTEKGSYQVAYSQKNPQWKMPARFYDFRAGPVHFVALDTMAIYYDQDDHQREAIDGMLLAADTRWKIAFGHHPFYSNGTHGNAGNYNGWAFVPIANGEHVRTFFEDEICGRVDLYLSGHDHSRQDLVPDCRGTQFVVSGAGARTTALPGTNKTHFQSDKEGFLVVDATDQSLTLRFFDANGVMDHERVVMR